MDNTLLTLKKNYLNIAVSSRVIQCDQNIHFLAINYLRNKLSRAGLK